MQNTRPTYSFALPLKDGSTVNCTIKTPKQKILSQFNKLQIQRQMYLEQSTALYMQTGPKDGQATPSINERIAAAIIAKDAAAEAEARRDLAAVIADIDELRDAQNQTVYDQVALITNLPNADDGTPRTPDMIDFEEVDPAVLTEALGFFVNGRTN